VYSRMVDFLEILRRQLESLAGNFMEVFSEVMNQLIDTFAANRDYLDHIADDVATYEMPLARISDLRESLDQTIKTMNMHDKTRDFMTMMLSEESIKAWITLNDNETTSNVSRYFTRLFNDFSRKTMTSYLQDKYCTTDPARLVRLIREDIMNKLENNATPMFWASALNPIDNASKLGYISVPNTCEEVVLAAESLREANSELTVRRTDIRDRISIMRCLVGAPMYGYQGLLQYEKNSVGDPAVGKHLYEGRTYMRDDGEMAHGRDWNGLPSPSPLSLMTGHNSPVLKKAGEAAADLYKKAEDAGTIVQTGLNEYGIRLITGLFEQRAKGIFEGAATKTNESKIEAQGRLAEMRSNIEYEIETIRIENDASPSLPDMNKRLVRIDHFAASPRLQEIAGAELDKLACIDKWMQVLEPAMDTDLTNFLTGLFTGAIALRIPRVEYENEFGEKTVLSSPDMQKGGVPLYQAYLNYLELDDETADAVTERTDKILKTSPLPEGACEACKAVDEELGAKNLKFMIEEANAVFPKEVKNVREFLIAARENLDRFTRRYRIDFGER